MLDCRETLEHCDHPGRRAGGTHLFLGVMAAPFAALLSAVLLSLSLVFLLIRARTCTQVHPRMVLSESHSGEETE